MYRLLRGRTFSEKLPKIPHFGTSLIHVTASWILQHPQSGVLLTLFSTWRTENSLAEINLESTGVLKGSNIFGGQKLAKTCSFVGGRIIVQQENVLSAERSWTNPLNALQEAIHYSFIKFCICCFFLWYELFVRYALRIEKMYQQDLNVGPFGISVSSAEGMSHQPIQNPVALFRGHRQNTRSHIP
jgi:hypothetical protein